MSMQYCHYCDKHVDTDFDAEHFETTTNAKCIIEEQDKEEAKKDLFNLDEIETLEGDIYD